MSSPTVKESPSATQIERMSSGEVVELLQSKDARIDALMQQVDALARRVDWFTRQYFGSRSERFISQADPAQMHLGEVFPPEQPARTPNGLRVLSSRGLALGRTFSRREPAVDRLQVLHGS